MAHNRLIGVVNRTNLKNYGSVLQVYALCEAIKRFEGYDSEVVWQSGNMSKNWDIRPNKVIKTGLKLLLHPSLLFSTIKMMLEVKSKIIEEETIRLFDEFVTNNIKQSIYTPTEIGRKAVTDKYYKFVCGSDQVWVTTTLYPDPMMYLRFAPHNKRIAYAPSLGRDYIPNYNKKIIQEYVRDIACISVREDTGANILKDLLKYEVPVVADPTLLLCAKDWDVLKSDITLPENYVLCYFLDEPSSDVKAAICKYVNKRNIKIVILGHLINIDLSEDDIIRPKAGPSEFLTITSNANMIITDSYHGMLFAINYHRNFWSVQRNYSQFDQSSRQMAVLTRLHLEKRHLKEDYNFTDENIDYKLVKMRIEEFVEFSKSYLKTSLEK